MVTTVGMVTDIVRQVAGERAVVEGLMGDGIDPHLYKPTRTDIGKLLRAEVVFYNGLLLEGKMSDALNRAAESGKKVYAVTELIDEDYLLSPEAFQGHPDPHVWMDPAAWAKAVEVVEMKLSAFDPEGAGTYAAHAKDLRERIEKLDAQVEQVLATVAEEQRVLVTAHDAFNYFGRRYGYEVVGIQGISTESEAGVLDLERIVNMLVKRKIRAVFVESTVSERNVRALIAGAGAQGHQVVIGGKLYSDAMGEPGTREGTYLGMIEHNALTVAHALGGQVPVGGLMGKDMPDGN